MEQNSAPVEPLRQCELSSIAQPGTLSKMFLNTGQCGLRAEGHRDGAYSFRLPVIAGKVPLAVEIDPGIPLHLGTGID
jgi:hypothetical protein